MQLRACLLTKQALRKGALYTCYPYRSDSHPAALVIASPSFGVYEVLKAPLEK
jgi:hypothetical protein